MNDPALAQRLRGVLAEAFGAEDFPCFTTDPHIPSVYFQVGGTPRADFERAAAGGAEVPSHHSPLFKVTPEESVTRGVEASVLALMELMGRR